MPKDVINRLADSVADQASRRRFFGWLAKAAVGMAGLAIGERLTSQSANAMALVVPLACCSTNGVGCAGYGCPSGYSVYYGWICCRTIHDKYTCNDCGFHGEGTWTYKCTYPTYIGSC
jgi:hypothetical protein